MKRILSVFTLSALLVACGSPKPSQETSATSLPTFSEAEYTADQEVISKSLAALEARGLKQDNNERSWEPKRYEKFKALPASQQREAIPDLELLKSSTTLFAAKYSSFHLQKADGSLITQTILPNLEGLRQLAISEIERLDRLKDTEAPLNPGSSTTSKKDEELKNQKKKPVFKTPAQRKRESEAAQPLKPLKK